MSRVIQKPVMKHAVLFAILAFIIPGLVMLGLFWKLQIYPFGNNTVVTGDFNNQYLALFSYFRGVLTGDNSVTYSLSLGLGGNFFGVLTYYLLSPINLTVLLFPTNQLPLFASFIVLAKISCIGLGMHVFLTKSEYINELLGEVHRDLIYKVSLVFSSAYALMGYVIAYKECIMWLDAIFLLPIVFLGMDRIIYRGRMRLFLVSFTIVVITNFYFGYIVGLFSGFVMLIWIFQALIRKNPNVLKVTGIYAFGALASLLISACVTLPGYLSTVGVAKNSVINFKPVYTSSNFVVQLFRSNPVEAGSPIIFVGIVALASAVLFFLNKNVKLFDKYVWTIILLFLFIGSWFDAFYLIWHAFAWPNGYVQREAFLIPFVICIIGFVGLIKTINQNQTGKKQTLFSSGLVLVVLTLIAASSLSVKYLATSLLLIVLCGLLVARIPAGKSTLTTLIILTISIFSLVMGNLNLETLITNGSMKAKAYKKFAQSTDNIVTRIKVNDDGLYRIGNRYQANDNDPLLFGYAGLSNYVSQQSTGITDFLSSSGYYQKHLDWQRWSNFNSGATLSFDRLLGVKYVYGSTSNTLKKALLDVNVKMGGDNVSSLVPFGEGIVTKNYGESFLTRDQSALPLVFRSTGLENKKSFSINYSPLNNPFSFQNAVWEQLGSRENILTNQTVKSDSSNHTFSSTLSASGNTYVYAPTSRDSDPRPVDVYVNGEKVSQLFVNDIENGIVYIGRYKRGDTISLGFSAHGTRKLDNSNIERTPFLATESEGAFQKIRHKLNSGSIYNQKANASLISFSTRENFREGNVVLTIPFDKHWTGYVDGHRTTMKRVAGELTSMRIDHGRHKVTLKYSVPGLSMGIWLSVMGVVLLAIYKIWVYRPFSKNH